MENEYVLGCPECSTFRGITSPVSKTEECFQCRNDPLHRFRMDDEGFLRLI
jgi:hypothetical protein